MDENTTSELTNFEHGWENPPKLSDLKSDFNSAKAETDKHRDHIKKWLDVRNIEGVAKVKAPKQRSKITPRLVRKTNEWRYSSLTEPFLSTDDLVTAKPITAEDVEAARQTELILNNQLTTKMSRVAFFDEYIRTLVDEGTALLRVGWELETEEVVVERPIQDPYRAQVMEMNGIPPVERVIEEKNIKNHPTVEVVPYTNFIIDPTCKGKIENAQFVTVSFDTSLSDLENSPIAYKNLDQVKAIASNNYGEDGDHNAYMENEGFAFNDKPRQQLTAYEYWGYWDVNGDGIVQPIVATWIGGILIRMEENPFPDKQLPFVLVQYMPVRHSCYGEPDAALLEDNQKISGAVMRGAIDIMARSSNGQVVTKKGALDTVNKLRKNRGEDYEINTESSPQDAMHMEKFPELPNSVFSMLQIQSQEAESISGIKAFSSGISGKALGEQGVGIKSALDATSKREVAIQRRLAEGIIKVCRKFISMSAEWLSEEEVVRLSNDEFVPIRRDNLNGDIDISLQISTPEADNEKAQELSFMLQTNGPNTDPGETRIIRAEIARLRNMPRLAKQIEEYEPPPPSPEEVQMQQLQIRKLEAEVSKLEAEAQEAQAKAQELLAKVGTEEAKAADYRNRADMTDLDYVEKETGVTHARELDKERVKQQGQAQIKAMDLRNKPKTS